MAFYIRPADLPFRHMSGCIHLCAIILLWMGLISCNTQSSPDEVDFDMRHPQIPVTRHAQIDSILSSLETISFDQLPLNYLQHAGIDAHWAEELRKKHWYVIRGDERYLYIVGSFRIRDFMAHVATIVNPGLHIETEDQRFLCIDRRVLHKLLDLLIWMENRGLDKGQIAVNYGFRHPALNKLVRGAKRSRHQWGEAIDLVVGDVNRDGQMDEVDKLLLLEVLDKKIIGSDGGVGRYPGTRMIHFDVRGHRARWDRYKPG